MKVSLKHIWAIIVLVTVSFQASWADPAEQRDVIEKRLHAITRQVLEIDKIYLEQLSVNGPDQSLDFGRAFASGMSDWFSDSQIASDRYQQNRAIYSQVLGQILQDLEAGRISEAEEKTKILATFVNWLRSLLLQNSQEQIAGAGSAAKCIALTAGGAMVGTGVGAVFGSSTMAIALGVSGGAHGALVGIADEPVDAGDRPVRTKEVQAAVAKSEEDRKKHQKEKSESYDELPQSVQDDIVEQIEKAKQLEQRKILKAAIKATTLDIVEKRGKTTAEVVVDAINRLKKYDQKQYRKQPQLGSFLIDTESLDFNPDIRGAEADVLNKRLQSFENKVARLSPATPDKMPEKIMEAFYNEFLLIEESDDSRLSAVLDHQGGNNEAKTKAILSVFHSTASTIKQPLAIAQTDSEYVPVILDSLEEPQKAINLINGNEIDIRGEKLWRTEKYYHDFLTKQGVRSPLEDKDFKIKTAPRPVIRNGKEVLVCRDFYRRNSHRHDQQDLRLKTKKELTQHSQQILHDFKNGKKRDPDIAKFFIHAEIRTALPETNLAQSLDQLQNEHACLAELLKEAKTPYEKAREVILGLDHLYLSEYSASRPHYIDYLHDQLGNCVARTKSIYQAFNHFNIQFEDPEVLAVQLYDDHVQMVLHNKETKTNIDLQTGRLSDDAPVFHPQILHYLFLQEMERKEKVKINKWVKPQELLITGEINPNNKTNKTNNGRLVIGSNSQTGFSLRGFKVGKKHGGSAPEYSSSKKLKEYDLSSTKKKKKKSSAEGIEAKPQPKRYWNWSFFSSRSDKDDLTDRIQDSTPAEGTYSIGTHEQQTKLYVSSLSEIPLDDDFYHNAQTIFTHSSHPLPFVFYGGFEAYTVGKSGQSDAKRYVPPSLIFHSKYDRNRFLSLEKTEEKISFLKQLALKHAKERVSYADDIRSIIKSPIRISKYSAGEIEELARQSNYIGNLGYRMHTSLSDPVDNYVSAKSYIMVNALNIDPHSTHAIEANQIYQEEVAAHTRGLSELYLRFDKAIQENPRAYTELINNMSEEDRHKLYKFFEFLKLDLNSIYTSSGYRNPLVHIMNFIASDNVTITKAATRSRKKSIIVVPVDRVLNAQRYLDFNNTKHEVPLGKKNETGLQHSPEIHSRSDAPSKAKKSLNSKATAAPVEIKRRFYIETLQYLDTYINGFYEYGHFAESDTDYKGLNGWPSGWEYAAKWSPELLRFYLANYKDDPKILDFPAKKIDNYYYSTKRTADDLIVVPHAKSEMYLPEMAEVYYYKLKMVQKKIANGDDLGNSFSDKDLEALPRVIEFLEKTLNIKKQSDK